MTTGETERHMKTVLFVSGKGPEVKHFILGFNKWIFSGKEKRQPMKNWQWVFLRIVVQVFFLTSYIIAVNRNFLYASRGARAMFDKFCIFLNFPIFLPG